MPSHVIRALFRGLLWSNTWLLTGQIWINQFFDSCEFKMQNKYGSLARKKFLQTKIGKVSFSHLVHGHWQKKFYKKINLVFQF